MTDHRTHMMQIFDRLFDAESPPATGPGPAPEPAFEAQVMLRSGYACSGVVTRERTPGGFVTLKMAVAAMQADPQHPQSQRHARKVIGEHYFDYEDVACVIVVRDVNVAKLVGDGPSIIMGG